MTATLSKTQIDRLGDRLRQGSPSEADLRLLDNYRLSFGEAYEAVVQTVRGQLKLEPTGRPAKSTSSLVEKLHRESIRLSQVQDIAGCRVIVDDVAAQERVVTSLCTAFPGATAVDRRVNPSYGYRAVHVIAKISEKLIEIQVRTPLQHLWAELSERLSDVVDSTIKYGGGEEPIRDTLIQASKMVANFELTETKIVRIPEQLIQNRPQLREAQQQMIHLRKEIVDLLSKAISWVENQKGHKL